MSNFLNFAGNQGVTFKDHGTGGGTSFTLDVNASTNSVMLSVGGVMQSPVVDYTVSGTTVTTTSSVTSGVEVLSYVIHKPGTAPTIQDATVTAAKISASGSPSGSTFLRGDMAWAAPSGGLVVQMIYSEIAKTSTTSATMGDDDTTPVVTEGTELDSQAITLADSSNKCLISGCINYGQDTGDVGALFALFRGSTCIWAAATDITGATYKADYISFNYLDSPSTASEITYSLRYAVAGGGTVRINFGTPADDQATLKTSSLLFTEISA